MEKISDIVKECRSFVGMTQSETISECRFPLSQQELSKIERGERENVSFKKILSILDALGLDFIICISHEMKTLEDFDNLREYYGYRMSVGAKALNMEYATLSSRNRKGNLKLKDVQGMIKDMALHQRVLDIAIDIKHENDTEV